MKAYLTCCLTTLCLAPLVFADTVVLKDGRSFEGTFKSKTAEGVIFDADGIELKLSNEDIEKIEMGNGDDAQVSAPKPEAATGTEPTGKQVAAGTAIKVKLNSPLSTAQHSAGHQFTATLAGAITNGSTVVVPEGSEVYGTITEANASRRLAGKASFIFTLTQVKTEGKLYDIKTSSINAYTDPTLQKSLGQVARGAAIGGLADGSSGARTGAKVGAGMAVLSRGNQVSIPAGTLVDFDIIAPVTID